MKKPLVALLVLIVLYPHPTSAQQAGSITQNRGLTVEQIISLRESGVTDANLIRIIQDTPTDFNLSLADINNLRNSNVPDAVLEAMLRSRRGGTAGTTSPPPPQPTSSPASMPTPVGINPTPANTGGTPVTTGTGSTGGAVNTGGTGAATAAATPVPLHSAVRLSAAKAVEIPPVPWRPPVLDARQCPAGQTVVELDFENGGPSVPRLNRSGRYCFKLINFNPLYSYSISARISSPTGDPLALLNSAIQATKNIQIGAAAAPPATPPTPNPTNLARTACTVQLTDALGRVTLKATVLQGLLARVVPNSGTDRYVPFAETARTWRPVPAAFDEFERSLRNLQAALPDVTNGARCDESLLAQAEAILVDEYPVARQAYRDLAELIANPQARAPLTTTEAEAVDTADVTVTSLLPSGPINSKAYHLDPSFGILSASAGFLLSRLPARSYTSVTAPNPADPTMTQNVLNVDNAGGTRTAFAVLLNANIPQLNRRNFGLGVSAGPVFDVTSGKADTSRFGLFGGLSARVTPWVFLTPGLHFGEFADFPQGFSRPGQVIPANTGTPTPVKRWTARFAFGITFKIRDLGSPLGGSSNAQSGGTTP